MKTVRSSFSAGPRRAAFMCPKKLVGHRQKCCSQHRHNRWPQYGYGSQIGRLSDDDLDRMKPARCGYIVLRIRVVNLVHTPQNSYSVEHSVRHVPAKIKQQNCHGKAYDTRKPHALEEAECSLSGTDGNHYRADSQDERLCD